MTTSTPATTAAAEEFLNIASEYHLGGLVTEAYHPATSRLSELAHADLDAALEALRTVDLGALDQLVARAEAGALAPMATAMHETWSAGRRVFFCGCGATGRLSVSLETFARDGLLGHAVDASQVVGFMAGGDAALVRSIESFEDHPEWGARMLDQLGFEDGDLLVSTTEGGETPYVIGATERAAERSPSNPPFFLYCNPDDVLARVAHRSARILARPDVCAINLTCGPMALAGSTRMQASTILMAAAGWAATYRSHPDRIGPAARKLRDHIAALDLSPLTKFIVREAGLYEDDAFLYYQPEGCALTVLTDTTERAPTFSFRPFENFRRPDELPARVYLHMPNTTDPADAWHAVLGRDPRTLEWDGLHERTGSDAILGFDFSDALVARRAASTGDAHHHPFRIRLAGGSLTWQLGPEKATWDLSALPAFDHHLVLKILLNNHSTMVAGRRGRYTGNMMTCVSPSNFKLIDRAARYTIELLRRDGVECGYEDAVHAIFQAKAGAAPDDPVVLRAVAIAEGKT